MAAGKAKDKKNFSLMDKNGKEIGKFTGKRPRDAALKAARRGVKDIVLKENGTNNIHYYLGNRTLAPVPNNAPPRIQESAKSKEGKIHKPNVKKIGTNKLKPRDFEKLFSNASKFDGISADIQKHSLLDIDKWHYQDTGKYRYQDSILYETSRDSSLHGTSSDSVIAKSPWNICAICGQYNAISTYNPDKPPKCKNTGSAIYGVHDFKPTLKKPKVK